MTRLTTLRSQLTSLRRARSIVRTLTAVSAAGIALLWALAAIFLIDVTFELAVPQRVVVLLLAFGAVAWAVWRYTLPLLGVRETIEDVALMVERQQEIDSDLVAALQFESAEAANWGSVQLESAVIDYVANVGSGLNVFEGFNREQMTRRATVLGVTAAVLLVAAIAFPGYATAFFNRLFLGGMHYPTATQIQTILVNQTPVLRSDEHGSAPLDAKCAQGRPIQFLVRSAGKLPHDGRVQLVSKGQSRSKTSVELKPLTLEQRLDRLKVAQQKLADARRDSEFALTPVWQAELLALLQFDAPTAAAELEGAKEHGDLQKVAESLESEIAEWPGDRESLGLYAGELPRLIDEVDFQLFLGDAWTDPASIAMTPLPAVEPRLTPIPPKYARSLQPTEETGQRQLSVLEGTAVRLAVECTNKKELTSVWLVLKTKSGAQRFDLVREDDAGLRWKLPEGTETPFDRVTEELRYEIQVQDTEQLSLESPIRGVIRIKSDRPPTGSAEVVHHVVLPTAQPVVHYRATDDFGLSQLNLIAEIERPTPDSDLPSSDSSLSGSSSLGSVTTSATATTAAEKRVIPLLQVKPLLSGSLPAQGSYRLNLAELSLAKGDRVKLTLEVIDYRGEDESGKPPLGQSYLSDPIALEISDESGVLAAISEADERSEQRLTDIIKRQLGIGESP